MSQSAFQRYAPFIQSYIYRKGWTDLRQVQVEACSAILDGEDHVIIASGTASGKTEAAFFPILTLLEHNPASSVGVMYIGPLKALINDQFQRLNELLEEQDIPVWPWHGDVSASVKRRALKQSRGILQITPESLESMLMRHPGDAQRLFSDLRFVIIDEIHALMGQDRGLQVLCLLSRLEKLTGCKPRRIGLSATLNDYKPAMDFLAAGSNMGAQAVGIQHQKRSIGLCAETFVMPADPIQQLQVQNQYYDFIYNSCHTKKCLLFTNSRGGAEEMISEMKRKARQLGEKDIFYVHHGSLAASLRQEAEHALRDNDGPTVAAATLTLELGIDIGDLDTTIQVGAPYSCSSFVQRLGRSGRRTGRSQMMFVNKYEDKGAALYDAMPWDLLRSIAVVQLYLEDRWVEPFTLKAKPFSLLAHQTLSALVTHGELTPGELAGQVLSMPPFKDQVTTDEYKELLRFMLQQDYLQRMDNGGLILGLKGERVTNYFSFYAVFKDEEDYQVISKEGPVGALGQCPALNEVFALGGRSWQVVSIDDKLRRIYAAPSEGSKVPTWVGTGADIHTRVVQRMKKILSEDTIYPYLQPQAVQVLQNARQEARSSGMLSTSLMPTGANSFYLAPWTGTKELRTIAKLLVCGLKDVLDIYDVAVDDHYLHITSGLDMGEFVVRCKTLQVDVNDPAQVLPDKQFPKVDKYDYMVPDLLLREAYLHNEMDVPGALEVLQNLS